MRLIRQGELKMAISVPVYQEYQDVLGRKKSRSQLGLKESDIEVILQFIAVVGQPTNIAFAWRPNLKDEADNMFVELAIASSSQYLVTNNIRDFTQGADLKNDDLRIVTPGAFLQDWRRFHGK